MVIENYFLLREIFCIIRYFIIGILAAIRIFEVYVEFVFAKSECDFLLQLMFSFITD